MENIQKINNGEVLTDAQKKELQELERATILMKADEIKEETFDFDIDGNLNIKNEIDELVLNQIDDPEAKFQLYYNVINRLLRKHLPKGDNYKKVREYIYEEKNTFLTRGHRKNKKGIRGADGKMGYLSDFNELIDLITGWVSERGTVFELYTRMRDLNISKGYGTSPLDN